MGEKNFTARTNYSFKFVLKYQDADGVAISLVGKTVQMDVRQADSTLVCDLVADLTPDGILITNAAGGEITVNVPPTETATWPVETLYYDVKLVSGSDHDLLLYGAITVTQGVTS
jgi:hypothetical protein